MTVARSLQKIEVSAPSIRRRIAPALLLATMLCASAVAQADVNESAPSNPDAALSGLLTVGNFNACYILESTAMKCWGYNNGNIGDGTTNDATTPQDVIGLTGVTAVSTGQTVCATTALGGLRCWGASHVNGSLNESVLANELPDIFASGVVMASVGGGSACAVLTGGELKCWGRNLRGQLGDGTTNDSLTPISVTGLTSGVTSVSVGDVHACALLDSGAVKCWGEGGSGQLGNGSSSSASTPTQVQGLTSGVVAISSGMDFSCALLDDGSVKCWGRGLEGQIGDAFNNFVLVPTQVSGLSGGVVAISAGDTHACALLASGSVKCWGDNTGGALGDGTTNSANEPVDVSGLDAPVKAVATGSNLTCVLVDINDVRCFGVNYYGELGNGTTEGSSVPVRVVGLAPEQRPGGGSNRDIDLDHYLNRGEAESGALPNTL